MDEEQRAFEKYFDEIVRRAREQGSEVKHWYKEIAFEDALRKIL